MKTVEKYYPHRQRAQSIKTLLLALILSIIGFLMACKKETAEPRNLLKENKYWRIVDVDIDGKEYTSKIIISGEAFETNSVNSNWSTTGWQQWTEAHRIWFCNNAPTNIPFYCVICKEKAVCKTTPVIWGNVGISDNRIYWNIETEVNVLHYRIEFSKDGHTFKPLATVSPKGGGYYSYAP